MSTKLSKNVSISTSRFSFSTMEINTYVTLSVVRQLIQKLHCGLNQCRPCHCPHSHRRCPCNPATYICTYILLRRSCGVHQSRKSRDSSKQNFKTILPMNECVALQFRPLSPFQRTPNRRSSFYEFGCGSSFRFGSIDRVLHQFGRY